MFGRFDGRPGRDGKRENHMQSNSFFQQVYGLVKQIPRGKVATYGQIAVMLGAPRMARQVGYALHVNPEPGVIPCHRVVNRFGGLAPAFAFGGAEVQAALLEGEGVEVKEDFSVELSVYRWDGESDEKDGRTEA